MMQYVLYAVLIVYSTRCILYSVDAVLGERCSRCEILIMAWRNRERRLHFVISGDGRVQDEKENEERI